MSIEQIRLTIGTLSHMITKGQHHNSETLKMMVDSLTELTLLELKFSQYHKALSDLNHMLYEEEFSWLHELMKE